MGDNWAKGVAAAAASGWAGGAALLAAIIIATAGLPEHADAASSFCRHLEERLAQPLGSARFHQYQRAVEEQHQELIRAERHAARTGCFDEFSDDPLCPGLLGTIDRMDRNLAVLELRRDQFASRDGVRHERARILAALEANRCREQDDGIRILPPPIAAEEQPQQPDSRQIITGPFDGGSFRTLCVRTCDGYYFPISFSVTRDQFARDEQKCQQMCPGTEVRLYSHRVPGEESKDMVSGAGTPYTELPNAFKYRQAGYVRPEGCGCSPRKNFSIIAGEQPEGLEADPQPEEQALIPPPDPLPESTADTGKPAAKAGDETASAGATTANRPEEDQDIRVVGPRFLPDPEGAIDLRSPGRPDVP